MVDRAFRVHAFHQRTHGQGRHIGEIRCDGRQVTQDDGVECLIDPFYEQTQVLAPDDIADGIAYMVTRPRHTAIAELWIMPTVQV